MNELKKKLLKYKEYKRTLKKLEKDYEMETNKSKLAYLKQKIEDLYIASEICRFKTENIINNNIIRYEHNNIMHEYYILNMSVEDIAKKECYSERYVWKIIKKSLEVIHDNEVNKVNKSKKNSL